MIDMRGRIAFLCLVAIRGATALPAPDAAACDPVGPRKDCGYLGIVKKACQAKGCCWLPLVDLDDPIRGGPQLEQPACFYTNTLPSVYQAIEINRTKTSTEAFLELKQATHPELGPDIETLRLSVETAVPDLLHVKITDNANKRWEVPEKLLAKSAEQIKEAADAKEPYKYVYKQHDDPFSFEILRPGNQHSSEPIWNTTGTRLIYKEQYLEITSWAPRTSTMYGLGERISTSGLQLKRNGKPMALWNRDCTDYPDLNLYGSHPFLMEVRPDGSAHGVLMWSSNGMDAVVTDECVSFRITGGVLDMYFFLGPTPMEVLEQYTRMFGRPALPPIWALGFHQSKYGYSSIWEMQEVVDNYTKANIPLDVMWGDIDYMERWRDFTFDPVNFPLPALQEFVERLHNSSQRFVPILDPGIPVLPGYRPYDEGIEQDIFIRDVTGQPYIGEVWPGAVHFPDFLNPKAEQWWLDMIADFYEKVPFDGLWVDMNEASNFCTGHVCEMPPDGLMDFVDPSVGKPFFTFGTEPPACQLQCWSLEPYLKQWLLQEEATRNMPVKGATGAFLGSLVKGIATTTGARPWQETDLQQATWNQFLKADAPPYAIANNNVRLPLSFRAIPVTARHYDGSLQYDAHNIYGLSQAAATHRALNSVYKGKRRPFVLTRSTFVGSSGWAAHWTGDNAATWDDLLWSVTGVLDAGLLGMPMIGADICGFLGIATEELCARWISVGAFYPFPRDHSDLMSGYQELYRWPEVAQAARYALGIRYSLLPYLYTSFRNTASHGCPLARAVMLGWPWDPLAKGVDRQWTMGDAVLITPVMEQGENTVVAYFPSGTWYSLTGHPTVDAPETGKTLELDMPLGDVGVHVLGGSIVPMQEPKLTTYETSKTPMTLLLAFPKHSESEHRRKVMRCGHKPPEETALTGSASGAWVAWGQLFIDTGEEQEMEERGEYVNFRAEVQPSGTGILTGTFSSSGEWHAADMTDCAEGLPWPVLDRVRMLGLPGKIDEGSVTFEIMTPGKIHPLRSIPVKASKVKQGNAEMGEVIVEGIGHRLECPEGIRLSWKLLKTADHGEEL